MKRALQSVALLCVLGLIAVGAASCGSEEFKKIEEAFQGFYDQTTNEDPPLNDNDDPSALYDSLCEAIEAGQLEFHFTNVDKDKVVQVFYSVLDDHPEYFWLSKGYSCSSYSQGGVTTITFTPKTLDPASIPQMRTQFESAAAPILSAAQSQPTVFDQILYIHDYIVENTQYDNDAYRAVSADQNEQVLLDSATAFGCLVNHRAICSGYSAAFQYLAKELGYNCRRVEGSSSEGESHEWNCILLDNEYYYVDVTWDDPVSADGTSNSKSYEFFCITTQELMMTHIINADQNVPLCNGNKYDYYIYNGFYLEAYDYGKVSDLINQNLGKDAISFKFSSARECQNAMGDLFEDGRIFDVNESLGNMGMLSYNLGKAGMVLTLNFE